MGEEITNWELARLLSRIESKLDKAIEDHEQRLRRLERGLYIAGGLAMTGGAGLSQLVGGWLT